jgi:hypothetical protein
MNFMKLITTLMALAIAAMGMLGMTAPAVLLEVGRWLTTGTVLYGVALGRIVFGVLLLLVAPASRMPGILRVIGAVIVIAGLLTPFFGVVAGEAFTWISGRPPLVLRAIAALPVALGLFIVFAINSRRDGGNSGDPR